jgi:hypothetical protein
MSDAMPTLEKDYLAALGRLRTGTITSPILLKRQIAGRLKITPRSVAEEAQRSHTPFSRTHKHLVKIIEAAAANEAAASQVASTGSHIAELRRQLAETRADRDKLATHNVALTIRVSELERRLARLAPTTKP